MTRIIAGSHRGHRLATPSGDLTRPTTDRVREAVFSAITSWAGGSLAGLSFLDLYAGSGAMALEALSRGATSARAVESDRRTADLVRANARSLGLPLQVHRGDVAGFLSAPAPAGGGFDVVWADPPYPVDTRTIEQLMGGLWTSGWLVGNGLAVLERGSRDPAPQWPAGTHSWSRTYGETTIFYAQEDR